MLASDPLIPKSSLTQGHRRVLVVSPHFPPVNAPDHQRIRIALPYLKAIGWDVTVLTVNPQEVPHAQDAWLQKSLPADLQIVTTEALPVGLTRKFGLGNLGLRCWWAFAQAGNHLLQAKAFDLVFFSTTIFPVMTLGAYWHRRFDVPYVIDFQDPWRVDPQQQRSRAQQRPGGRWKYAMDKLLARWLEPIALSQVSHVLSVSPTYPDILQQRYPWLHPEQFTVLPFGAPEQDFARLPQLGVRQFIFDPADGKRHWVYVGRGGSDMKTALNLLFSGIQSHRLHFPQAWDALQIHFVGTSYAGTDETPIVELAKRYQLADLVTEHPHRVPYFEAQQILIDSDAIVLIGSDDPSYSASKIYPTILAHKPVLAIFHHQSLVVDILQQCQVGSVVTFGGPESQPEDRVEALTGMLTDCLQFPPGYQPATNWAAFAPYSGEAMTNQLCQIFEAVRNSSVCGSVAVKTQPWL
jgi:hypothetical protein